MGDLQKLNTYNSDKALDLTFHCCACARHKVSRYQFVLVTVDIIESDRNINEVHIIYQMQPLCLTFNIFLTVFTRDHLNEGNSWSTAINILIHIVPVTAWHYHYNYTVLLGICKKVKLVIIQTDLINVITFLTIYDFYKLLSYSLANI